MESSCLPFREVAKKTPAPIGPADWRTPDKLLLCPQCGARYSTFSPRNKCEHWAVILRCGICADYSWVVCVLCDAARRPMQHDGFVTISRHGKRHAVEEDVVGSEFDTNDDPMDAFGFDDAQYSRLSWVREESVNFFSNHARGAGTRFLVNQAQTQNSCVAPLAVWNACNTDLDMKLTELCMNLSRPNIERLAMVMKLIAEQTGRQLIAEQTGRQLMFIPSIPTSYNQLRSRIWEGKHAIIPNLPHPVVHSHDGIAYLSIIEIIVDAFGHGIPFATIEANPTNGQVNSFVESERALQIKANADREHQGRAEVILALKDWKDGYNAVALKDTAANMVEKKTLTLPAPAFMRTKANLYTYPLYLGPKHADYEFVERLHNAELKTLCSSPTPFTYSKFHGREIGFHAEMFASLADQPQRREDSFIMAGNGAFSANFLFKFEYKQDALLSGMPQPTASTWKSAPNLLRL